MHFILGKTCSSGINSTSSTFSTFQVTGIPGLEAVHIWISLPFCAVFLQPWWAMWPSCQLSLHVPMYLFLVMLAASDLGLSLFTFPTMLRIFWLDARRTHLICLLHPNVFTHTLPDFESVIILAMAFDHYVAISHPLHYSSILTSSVIARISLAIVGRATMPKYPFLSSWGGCTWVILMYFLIPTDCILIF